VDVIINDKQMDAGRFLFNRDKNDKDEIIESLIDKLEEFIKWYGNFQNKEPIKKVELISGDFTCEKNCRMPLGFRASIVDSLIPANKLDKVLSELCEKYELELDY